jgi:hypothetical protein
VGDIEDAVRRYGTIADGVRWVNAYGHASKALDYRNVAKIDHVAVRCAEIGTHTSETEDDVGVAL